MTLKIMLCFVNVSKLQIYTYTQVIIIIKMNKLNL